MKSHKDLKVWQESIIFVKDIYKLTNHFPSEEKYGLGQQMHRCAVSILSNIAEGAGRNSNKEWTRFLYISLGSLAELDTQINIAKMLDYITEDQDLEKRCIFIRIMITKLITSLNKTDNI